MERSTVRTYLEMGAAGAIGSGLGAAIVLSFGSPPVLTPLALGIFCVLFFRPLQIVLAIVRPIRNFVPSCPNMHVSERTRMTIAVTYHRMKRCACEVGYTGIAIVTSTIIPLFLYAWLSSWLEFTISDEASAPVVRALLVAVSGFVLFLVGLMHGMAFRDFPLHNDLPHPLIRRIPLRYCFVVTSPGATYGHWRRLSILRKLTLAIAYIPPLQVMGMVAIVILAVDIALSLYAVCACRFRIALFFGGFLAGMTAWLRLGNDAQTILLCSIVGCFTGPFLHMVAKALCAPQQAALAPAR